MPAASSLGFHSKLYLFRPWWLTEWPQDHPINTSTMPDSRRNNLFGRKYGPSTFFSLRLSGIIAPQLICNTDNWPGRGKKGVNFSSCVPHITLDPRFWCSYGDFRYKTPRKFVKGRSCSLLDWLSMQRGKIVRLSIVETERNQLRWYKHICARHVEASLASELSVPWIDLKYSPIDGVTGDGQPTSKTSESIHVSLWVNIMVIACEVLLNAWGRLRCTLHWPGSEKLFDSWSENQSTDTCQPRDRLDLYGAWAPVTYAAVHAL